MLISFPMDDMMVGPGLLAPRLANVSIFDGLKGIGDQEDSKPRRTDELDRCLILSYIFSI